MILNSRVFFVELVTYSTVDLTLLRMTRKCESDEITDTHENPTREQIARASQFVRLNGFHFSPRLCGNVGWLAFRQPLEETP